MSLSPDEIAALLLEQYSDSDEEVLLLQPLEGLPCIYALLEDYLPEQAMGLEIMEANVTTASASVIISGYAPVFGLPPVKMEATFSVIEEEVTLSMLVSPEMGVTPAGLFPELSGSGLWLPLQGLKLELKSHAEQRGMVNITAGISPGLDDLLEPLLPLLAEFAPVSGAGEIGEDGTLRALRIETSALPSVTLGIVTLSDIKIALLAEEDENALLRAALLLEGEIAIELSSKTVTVGFQLIPAPPDRPFHILSAQLDETNGETVDSNGLGIPMPPGIPATLKLQSIRVLLGAVSGVPEDITISALLDGRFEVLPGLEIENLGGAFTLWPTTEPISGRADIYGRVILGGAAMDFNLAIPEQDFSVELDPQTAPNLKQMVGELVNIEMPDAFPDMDIDGFSISGNVNERQYQFYFGLSGEWDFQPIIGLNISLKSISITGNVDSREANTRYFGVIQGLVQLGDSPEGEENNDGLIQLRAQLTSGGDWVLEGGLAAGSELSLPQLVSVVGISSESVPHDLRTLVITELNASLNTSSGKATFKAASEFSLAIPFGGGDLDLRGSISLSQEKTGDPWIGEAAGEAKFKTLRFKVAFPINDPAMDMKFGLWLPKPGNPDDGAWLECSIESNDSGSIEKITITLPDDMNIFSAVERFINLMIPGFTLDFPYPWDELERLDLPETTIVINLVENSVALGITEGFNDINKVPGIDIRSIGLIYDMDDSNITFKIDGIIFGEVGPSFNPVTEDPPAIPLPDIGFELHYLGLGRHVAMRDVAGYERVGDAIDDLRHAFDRDPREGSSALGPLRYNSESEWLIGFDFSAAGFLRIGALFNDPLLYGLVIRLDGPAAKAFSGFEFEILYKRIAPGLGVYSIELELPSATRTLEFGAVSLTLPVIGVDIYTNGNFKLDLGFPYGANFGRSFAISFLPFAGAGGFYFASLNGATSTTVPRIVNGEFDPVIEFGIGLTVGLGKSFGSGSFQARIYVGVLAILEGCFATFLPYDKNAKEAQFYRINGTFGIYAILAGRIDFKIICVSFTAELYLIAVVVVESYAPFYINARAGVRISARVKIGWFKITFRFSHEVRVSYTFGNRRPTPWIVGNRALTAGMGRGYGLHNKRLREQDLPMTMGASALSSLASNSFSWFEIPTTQAKINITWYSWFGVTVDLDAKNDDEKNTLNHLPVATPLAGFAEFIDPNSSVEYKNNPPEDFSLWIERVFHWCLNAWHSTTPEKILFSSVYNMNRDLQEEAAADSIGWSELNNFISENFAVTLKGQPPATADREYKMALVPLPPALHIKFDVDAKVKELDLSVAPLVEQSALSNIKERSFRYVHQTMSTQSNESATAEDQADVDAPMSEWLWKDAISLQIKELVSRLLSLMEACPIKIAGKHNYTSLGGIYETLAYDPDPNDADREPYFEEFVEANMGKTDILNDIDQIEIIIPLDSGDENYLIQTGDSLEQIADKYGISALELASANLYVELVKPDSIWTVPYIKELLPAEAWDKLTDSGALSDIAAMTSRFLLHGVRMPVDGVWKNLYEAGGLQFDLPAANSTEGSTASSAEEFPVKLTLTTSTNGHKADWLAFENETQAAQNLTTALSSLETVAQNLVQIAKQIETEENQTIIDAIVQMQEGLIAAIHNNEVLTVVGITDTLIIEAGLITGNDALDSELQILVQTKVELESAIEAQKVAARLELKFTENEEDALNKILLDRSFEPEATVTGMAMTREEQLDFSLAQAIPLRRLNIETSAIETYGRLRVLPPSFFQFIENSQKQDSDVAYDWIAQHTRKAVAQQEAAEKTPTENLKFKWAARLDIEVMKLDREAAVKGRTIYRIARLAPDTQLRLERVLADVEQGLITVNIAPATGVAGAASRAGGLLVGAHDAKEIVLFRNDADDRPETPADADNMASIDFLRLLAESLDEEVGTFFFADVLPDVDDTDERIFSGSNKGTITLMLYLQGEVDPARHADSIYLVNTQDKGAAPIRLTAEGLTQKKARFEPGMLHFRVERPEPHQDTADALESLYSLVSFAFSDEKGNDLSPPSLPVGPREEKEGIWLYEQVVPMAAAFAERQEIAPYSAVGETRWLNISWRDLFGNEASAADYTFKGYATPLAPEQDNITRLPLTCYYYDDIIGVNRWPGVQASHLFSKNKNTTSTPELSLQIKFDPSIIGEREENAADAQSTKEELSKVIAQLQDSRLQVFVQTSLEAEPSQEAHPQWKNDLFVFLHGVDTLIELADMLEPLEVRPRKGVNIGGFLKAHRITIEELAKAIQTRPLGELLDQSEGIPLLKIPIKWQIGTDSLNSIALALNITTDILIESLLARHADEPGLLNPAFANQGRLQSDTGDAATNKSVMITPDLTIAEAANQLGIHPAEFLLEFADREGLLTPKRVIIPGERNEAMQADESLGELTRRMQYTIETEIIGGSITSGFAVAPEQREIIAANTFLQLSKASPILFENRQIAPAGAVAGEAWKSSEATNLATLAGELGVSVADFAILNSRRADIIEKGIVISIIIAGDKTEEAKTYSVKTVIDDSFETLRKALSALAGKTIPSAEFAMAIADVDILKPGSLYLVPPTPVVLSRSVKARKTPAAYELNAQLVLQRLPQVPSTDDLELVHPQLHDQKAVWYMASDIATSVSAQSDTENKPANMRPYALSFQNAFTEESLQIGMGARRRGTGDKPSLWVVKLGKGGFYYEIASENPAFLSLRPLSTTLMNRKKIPVFKFVEDQVNLNLEVTDDAYELRNYSDIDFDEWAINTLRLLDRLLRPASALALSEIEKTEKGNKYDQLLAARARLASALTLGLTEIVDYPAGEPAKSDVTRRIMKERIGNRLASAYDIDTVAMFPLSPDGEPFEARGGFTENREYAKDTGYTLQPTHFTRNDKWLVMAVDVLKPEEHRTIDTKAAFQLNGLEFRNEQNDEIVLSFVIPPDPSELGELVIPIPLRDMPEAPRLARQQGVADFEMGADGYPQIDSFDDLLAWRYEVDFMAEFAEQDTHSMEIFFNLAAGENLPPMLGGHNGRLFEDLFHALAQCDATLEKYAHALETRVEAKFAAREAERADLHWILDDMIVLVDELAYHWREHYERGGAAVPMTLGETLQTSKHRYEFTEERHTVEDKETKKIIKDDLRYVFKCAPGDPVPMVRVDGVTGKTSKPKIKTLSDGEKQAIFTVTMTDWFRNRTSDELEEMPRRFGFQDLHILEKQNVRIRIKTVRNAKLLEGADTAEAFIYRTPVVTLPDRFFPSVEMEPRVRISQLTKINYNNPTEILADVLQRILGLGLGKENAGIKRRLALTVRYGFSLTGQWSDLDSFASETPLFFEPRFILDHVPDTKNGIDPNADDAVSRLGREMQGWMDNAGARRENAGFVIGVDVYTDETLNPALVEPNSEGRGAADDARLIRIMRLEVDFPGSKKPASEPELKKYYINKNAQSNGDHEIHISDCQWFPASKNRVYLGEFSNCKEAVIEAKKKYNTADGCAHCLPGCHTS